MRCPRIARDTACAGRLRTPGGPASRSLYDRVRPRLSAPQFTHNPTRTTGGVTVMSRAFVKEADGVDAVENLPERPVSAHPNFVTAEGLASIEVALERTHREHAQAQAANDRAALARTARDLRYWTSRRTTAQVIAPP